MVATLIMAICSAGCAFLVMFCDSRVCRSRKFTDWMKREGPSVAMVLGAITSATAGACQEYLVSAVWLVNALLWGRIYFRDCVTDEVSV